MRHGTRTRPALANDAVGTEVQLTNDDGGVELVDDLGAMGEGAGPQFRRGAEEVHKSQSTGGPGADLAPVRFADEVVVGKVSVAVGEGLAGGGVGEGEGIERFEDDDEGVGDDDLGRGQAPLGVQARVGKAERTVLFGPFFVAIIFFRETCHLPTSITIAIGAITTSISITTGSATNIFSVAILLALLCYLLCRLFYAGTALELGRRRAE